MAEYIEREAFIADKKWLYCTDCDKRKGKKRGKMVTLYEIGEAPCKSCGIHDMLEEVEMYPAADVRSTEYCEECRAALLETIDRYKQLCADVRPVVLCRDCVHFQQFRPHDGFCKIDGMLWNNDFFCANGMREEN